MVVYVIFLSDVACQKLLNSANVSRSYSQNNTGTVFLRHGVEILIHTDTYKHAYKHTLTYVYIHIYIIHEEQLLLRKPIVRRCLN